MHRRELCYIHHTNINSKLNLFTNKLHPNKKGQGIFKVGFRRFINNCKFWYFSQGDDIVLQNSNIPLNATLNTGNVSSATLLISSNNSEKKDPQSFLKDLKIKNMNRLIIGQVNINSFRNKFEQLSTIIINNDIIMISEIKLDEPFTAMQFSLQGFACLIDFIVILMAVALCFILERTYLHDLWKERFKITLNTFSLKPT